MSGSEMQRAKESAADIMRAKQAAGTSLIHSYLARGHACADMLCATAEAKKAAEKK
jgi:hypothetical protein